MYFYFCCSSVRPLTESQISCMFYARSFLDLTFLTDVLISCIVYLCLNVSLPSPLFCTCLLHLLILLSSLSFLPPEFLQYHILQHTIICSLQIFYCFKPDAGGVLNQSKIQIYLILCMKRLY